MTNPVSLPFIVRSMFLSCLTLRNASSFFTRSVQLIFFILLQQIWIRMWGKQNSTALAFDAGMEGKDIRVWILGYHYNNYTT